MEAMGFSGFNERLYGKVDYKKAVYAFIPDAHPVALMLDAKAEKENGDRTATIQLSQTSMAVRMRRSGSTMDEAGRLDRFIERGGRKLYVVTIIAKYTYIEDGPLHRLRRVIVACIPNGILQESVQPIGC